MYEGDGEEESLMLEEDVTPQKATIIQQRSNSAQTPQTGSVALPAVIRPGVKGLSSYNVGNMSDEQFATASAISHKNHQPPLGYQAQVQHFNPGQKALLKNCDDGNQRIRIVVEDLSENRHMIPEHMGNDPVSH